MNNVFSKDNSQIGFSLVRVLVTRFINSFGFSTKMNDEQLDMITVDTLDAFGYESIVDVILFFKMARSGKFGETNRGVDSNLIFGKWFPLYLEKKAEVREAEHQKKKEDQKLKENFSIDKVEITYKKALTKKIKVLNEEKRTEYINKTTKNMDRQMLEDTIKTWESDLELKKYVDLLKMKRKEIK